MRSPARRHPIRRLVAIAIPEVVDDVIAAFDDRERARARHFAREFLGVRVRRQSIFRARDQIDRASDVLRDAGKRHARGDLARLV